MHRTNRDCSSWKHQHSTIHQIFTSVHIKKSPKVLKESLHDADVKIHFYICLHPGVWAWRVHQSLTGGLIAFIVSIQHEQ